MRECWVIEEQDKETDEWRTEITFEHEDAAVEACKRWQSDYKHRVVRYVPEDVVAQVGWQPIETAPKDGTVILAYVSGGHHALVAWNDDWEDWLHLPWHESMPAVITYWMPLPAPPQEDRP